MSEVEVLSGIKQRDYYLNKIEAIKQDIRENENGIKFLYSKKLDLIKPWAICLEELHDIEINTICRTIVNELIAMDCKRGVKYVYKLLDKKYKRDYKQDLSGLGDEEEESNVEFSTFETAKFLELPNEIISLETAPREDIQENEEALAKLVKETKRRWQEYIDVMRRRGIAREGQRESDVIGTPKPYDIVHGYFYEEMAGLSEDLANASSTCRDIAEKIEHYPPENQKEDRLLADGIKVWRPLFQWWNDQLRPYADLKFSMSYPEWFKAELLNRDYGKHAAAVKSKVSTLTGNFRAMTREQLGDKQVVIADKAIEFKGMLEMANKAFELFQKNMPNWHKRRVAPSVATRKEMVGPRLSESAFGSDRNA